VIDCVPLWCNPTYPGTPFGTWYLAIFDVLRVVCVIAALGLIGQVGAAWRRSVYHGGQRDRYAALALFAMIAIGTELADLGNIASYRLVVDIIAVLLAIRGLRRFRGETPAALGMNPDA
jgi:hypothetical protein